MANYKIELIKSAAQKIKSAGYRVFIAASGEYGFFTDKDGSRVVSFQIDFFSLKLTGNYSTNNMKQTGSGWSMGDFDIENLSPELLADKLYAVAPHWAVGGSRVTYTTLVNHLSRYDQSSKYTEFTGD